MYTYENFKTKKALKDAVASGQEVRIYQPGPFNPPGAAPDYTGREYIEGPHSPEPHKWYATVELVDGKIVKVK